MDRRSFHRGLVLTALSPAAVGCTQSAATSPAQGDDRAASAVHRRTLIEYALPPAAQTHELVKLPGAPLVLVSQQSNSQLVKLWLDPGTEQIIGVQAFPLGPADAMLHGLALSNRHPGLIWATHEMANKLLLVDPGAAQLDAQPKIMREIDVPGGGRGPHLWASTRICFW